MKLQQCKPLKPKPCSRGNPTVWPEMYSNEIKEIRRRDINMGLHKGIMDMFLKNSMLDVSAMDYVEAFYNNFKGDEVWDILCARIFLQRQEHELPYYSLNPQNHFNALASVVVEECRHTLSEILATRWLDSTYPEVIVRSQPRQLIQNTCEPMKMILQETGPVPRQPIIQLGFHLPDGDTFCSSHRSSLRPGTIVECLPDGEHNGLKSVMLGVIVHSNSSSGQLTVHTSDLYYCTHYVTNWILQPLTSFVSEIRQIEACLALRRGDARPDFLGVFIGRKPSIKEMKAKKVKRNKLASPKPVLCGPDLSNFMLSMESAGDNAAVELNSGQVKAVMDFVESAPGSITCIQGPPGSGKTTLLVATIQEYLHRKLVSGTNAKLPLLVAAPTNKATIVVASRLYSSNRQHVYPNKYGVKVALVGDDSKLTEDEVHSGPEEEGSGDGSLRKVKHLNVYHFLQSALLAFQHLLKAMDTKPGGFMLSNLPDYDQYTMFLERYVEAGFLFKKSVKARAEKFLGWMRQNRSSEQGKVEDLKKIISDVSNLSQDPKMRRLLASYLLRTADVIFCTLATTGSPIFKGNGGMLRIGDLIVDEASCASEAEVVIPFQLNPSRAMFVGDPLQLPATIKSPKAKLFKLGRSVQERLTMELRLPSIMLNQQYRMRPEIAVFPSRRFYQGLLQDAVNVIRDDYRSPLPLLKQSKGPFYFQQVEGEESKCSTGSWQNEVEADKVVEFILKLQSKAEAQDDSTWYSCNRLRIITFYQAQVNLINSKLAEFGFGTPESGLMATTVDSSQGCESDCVIVSFVRTCKDTAGFLDDDRRINVALTRAKFELICVGNRKNMRRNEKMETLQALALHARKVKRERKELGETKKRMLAEEVEEGKNKKRQKQNSVRD